MRLRVRKNTRARAPARTPRYARTPSAEAGMHREAGTNAQAVRRLLRAQRLTWPALRRRAVKLRAWALAPVFVIGTLYRERLIATANPHADLGVGEIFNLESCGGVGTVTCTPDVAQYSTRVPGGCPVHTCLLHFLFLLQDRKAATWVVWTTKILPQHVRLHVRHHDWPGQAEQEALLRPSLPGPGGAAGSAGAVRRNRKDPRHAAG